MSLPQNKPAYRRRPSSLPAIISISLVLFMLGVFGFIIIWVNQYSEHVRENFQVNVFLRDDASEDEIIKLQKTLEQEAFTRTVTYVSKEQASKTFSAEVGHDFVSFIGYNPLWPSLELKLKATHANEQQIAGLEKQLLRNPIVQEVSYQRNLIGQVNENLMRISWYVLFVSALFFVITIILINNTIRLSMYARRFLIKSMQLVGATQWFIIRPFLVRAMLHGIYATLLSAALMGGLLSGLTRFYPEIQGMYDYSLFALLFAGMFCTGVLISILSSLIATKRYLRLKLDDLY